MTPRLSSLLSTTLLLLGSTATVVSAQKAENFRGNAVAAAASSTSYQDSADECVTSQFISLADDPDAIKLGISTFDGVETDTIDLQQAFQFRGNVAVSQLVVTQHGSIHLDPSQRTAEEGPLPIQAANGNNAAIKGPRIQVAQTSFTISNVGKAGVYYKDLGSALLVSWEPALVAGGRMLAQFQVSLEYATGDVNMQWKGLGPIGDTIPVSVGIIQDDSSQLQQQQLVSPATGAPFGNQGVAQYPSVFSQDTCRKFRVVKSAAAKPDEEPTVVRGRHLR